MNANTRLRSLSPLLATSLVHTQLIGLCLPLHSLLTYNKSNMQINFLSSIGPLLITLSKLTKQKLRSLSNVKSRLVTKCTKSLSCNRRALQLWDKTCTISTQLIRKVNLTQGPIQDKQGSLNKLNLLMSLSSRQLMLPRYQTNQDSHTTHNLFASVNLADLFPETPKGLPSRAPIKTHSLMTKLSGTVHLNDQSNYRNSKFNWMTSQDQRLK